MGDIFVMNPDGSGQRNLTRDPAFYSYIAWSPDGRRIAFAAQKRVRKHSDVWATNLYVINPDGSGLRRLTWSAWNDQPVWSPDGRRIAFLGYRSSGRTVYDVYVVNADGTGLRRLTRTPMANEYALDWSRRNRIAFVREGEIFTMKPDGSDQRRLTHTADGESGLAWSPNGRRLVFVRWLNARDRPSVFAMNADGTNERRLLPTNRIYDFYNWPQISPPSWSPDGSRIAFVGGSAAAQGADQGLYVMRANGAGLHRVAGHDPGPPSWAPDSRRMAFDLYPGIYVVNASGTGQHRILPRPGRPASPPPENGNPSWAPRGRH